MFRIARMGLLFLAFSVGSAASPAAEEDRPAEADLAQVRAFIAHVQRAANAGDRAAVAESFDIDAVVAFLQHEGFFARLAPEKRASVASQVRRAFGVALARADVIEPFTSFEIRGVAPGPIPDTFAVYLRCVDDERFVSKERWHLRRRGSLWRVYDIEDLESGVGMTGLLGAVFIEAAGGTEVGLRAAAQVLGQIESLMEAGAFGEARALLESLETSDLPDLLKAIVQMQLAAANLGEGETEAAIAHARQAAEMKPDMPVLDYLRAVAFNLQGEHAAALSHARRYIAAVDPDAQVSLELGRALYGLGRRPEAVKALRSSLAEEPNDYEALAYLALSLPPEKRGEIATLLTGREEPLADFGDIADICMAEGAPEVLRLFTSFLAKKDPEGFEVPYYEGQAFLLEEAPGKAVERFAVMLERLAGTRPEPEDRAPFYEAYLDGMIALDRHLAAFEACPDKRLAFRYLAEDLSIEERPDVLMDLVARAGALDELLLERRFYAADAQFLRKQYAQALALLRPLLAQERTRLEKEESDDALDLLWEIEDRLIRSLVRTKAFDEALGIAKAVAERDADFDYLLIVHANRGDVKAALDALEKAVTGRDDAERLFEDVDLESVLATPAYAEARAKYLPER